MITIHRLVEYRKDKSDHLVHLYINARGFAVDYEHDLPPIELLPIPKSQLKSLCVSFLSSVIGNNRHEIILTEENINLFKSELLESTSNEANEVVLKEILKFIGRYEAVNKDCHLAYHDEQA